MIDSGLIHKVLGFLVLFVILLLIVDVGIHKWRKEKERNEQIEALRIAIMEDNRWMASNPIASRLTERYLDILSDDWTKKVIESSDSVRSELGIDPHLVSGKRIMISPDGQKSSDRSFPNIDNSAQ